MINTFNPRTKKSLKTLGILLGVFLVIIILEQFNFFHFEIFSNDLSTSRERSVPNTNSLVVEDQASGPYISIKSAALTEPGYVVVHIGSSPQDRGVAATNLLQPGSYFNFSLVAIRNVKPGEVFTVMIHKDNGDGILHLEEDLPARNSGGIITGKIKIL